MPVVRQNTNSFPASLLGSLQGTLTPPANASVSGVINTAPAAQPVLQPNQVLGLVPVFPCTPSDCRQGNYTPDGPYADDMQIPLSVFATLNASNDFTDYKNDWNSWIFQYSLPMASTLPALTQDFLLEKLINGVWTSIANLNNNTYGTFLTGFNCTNSNYQGYTLQWKLVLNKFGTGTYRFAVTGRYIFESSYCWATPPFCLQVFSCHAADRTVKFESSITGGNRGSVISQGTVWNLCCQKILSCVNIGLKVTGDITRSSMTFTFVDPVNGTTVLNAIPGPTPPLTASAKVAQIVAYINGMGLQYTATQSTTGTSFSICTQYNNASVHISISNPVGTISTTPASPVTIAFPYSSNTAPITYKDAIRFEGFFGRQTNEIQRDLIKYQNGVITKVRDELLKKYELWVAPMPQWFHDRFSAYALMADQLYVSDYNYNNANYNFNQFFVAADSGWEPEHKFESRFARIGGTAKFKEGQQLVYADRCC